MPPLCKGRGTTIVVVGLFDTHRLIFFGRAQRPSPTIININACFLSGRRGYGFAQTLLSFGHFPYEGNLADPYIIYHQRMPSP